MNGFFQSTYLTSGATPASIPGSNNAFGAWTVIWSNVPAPLDGYILTSYCSVSNSLLNIGIGPAGSTSPTFIQLNNFQQAAAGGGTILVPIRVPAGATIFGQGAINGNTGNLSVTLSGIPSGNIPPSMIGNQILSGATGLSDAYFQTTFPGSSITQLTTTPTPDIVKMIWLNNTGNSSFQASIGIGPSTTLDEYIIENMLFYNSGYVAQLTAIPCFVPPGNNFFLDVVSTNGNQGTFLYLI